MNISYKELVGLIEAAYKLGQDNSPISDIIDECKDSMSDSIDHSSKISESASKNLVNYTDKFETEFVNAYNAKDVNWFLQEYNAQSCFYHMSKEMVERVSKVLVPHLIENYKHIFEVPLTRQSLREELFEEVPWVNIMFSHYRSIDIMFYRCFDFMVFEREVDFNVMIVYRVLSNKDMQNLRKGG